MRELRPVPSRRRKIFLRPIRRVNNRLKGVIISAALGGSNNYRSIEGWWHGRYESSHTSAHKPPRSRLERGLRMAATTDNHANHLTAERWQKIKELFHAALEREPNERRAFLDEACAGDKEIRREVESLLA